MEELKRFIGESVEECKQTGQNNHAIFYIYAYERVLSKIEEIENNNK